MKSKAEMACVRVSAGEKCLVNLGRLHEASQVCRSCGIYTDWVNEGYYEEVEN